MTDDVRFILESAVRAPSGDNNQPWHWVVRGTTLELWGRFDHGPLRFLYDCSDRASYIALGAAIENVFIAATARGYRAVITYFPDATNQTLIAIITLQKDEKVQQDPLIAAVPKRSTNRKPFQQTPLDPEILNQLLDVAKNKEFGELHITSDRKSINELAGLVSLQDEFMFSVKEIHDYLFSHINWTKKEDDRRRSGFYFPSLGVPAFSWVFMQLLRQWWITLTGRSLGLHKIIALEQQALYRRAGGYGLISIRNNTPVEWLQAGRLVERVWLTATNVGLSIQPTTGIIFLNRGAESASGQDVFTPDQHVRLRRNLGRVQQIFGVSGNTTSFMFRVGYAQSATVRTSRLPLDRVAEVVH